MSISAIYLLKPPLWRATLKDRAGRCGCVWGCIYAVESEILDSNSTSAFGIVCGLGQDLFQNLSANFAGKVIYLAFKEYKIKQHFWELLVNIYILHKHEYFPRGRRVPWVVKLPSHFPKDLVSPPQLLLRNRTGAQLGYCWEAVLGFSTLAHNPRDRTRTNRYKLQGDRSWLTINYYNNTNNNQYILDADSL